MTARQRQRSVVDRLVRELAAGRRPGLLLVLWRWRWECLLALLAAVLVWAAPPVALLVGVVVLAALYTLVPAVKRVIDGRFWCVTTQHLLRVGFKETNLRSWGGRRPAILWASAHPAGQRILVSCPAGVDVAQIEAVRGELAAACWAADVLVERHPRHANLVLLLIQRTPPPGRGESSR